MKLLQLMSEVYTNFKNGVHAHSDHCEECGGEEYEGIPNTGELRDFMINENGKFRYKTLCEGCFKKNLLGNKMGYLAKEINMEENFMDINNPNLDLKRGDTAFFKGDKGEKDTECTVLSTYDHAKGYFCKFKNGSKQWIPSRFLKSKVSEVADSVERANIKKMRADAQKMSARQKELSQLRKNTSDKASKARISKQTADIAGKKADLGLTIATKSQELKDKPKMTEDKDMDDWKYKIGQSVYLTKNLYGNTFKKGTEAKIHSYAVARQFDYWIKIGNNVPYAVRQDEISDVKPTVTEMRIKIKELVPVKEFMQYEPDNDYIDQLVMIGKNMSDAYKTRNAVGAIEVAIKELRKEKYAEIDAEIKLAKKVATKRLADYWSKEDKPVA